MKRGIIIFFCALLWLPGLAAAQSLDAEQAEEFRNMVSAHPAECARLRRQIEHFTNMGRRAQALQNELWTERTAGHVELLKGMQAARCPNDVPVDHVARAMEQLLKLGAKAALTYFTFGAAGF